MRVESRHHRRTMSSRKWTRANVNRGWCSRCATLKLVESSRRRRCTCRFRNQARKGWRERKKKKFRKHNTREDSYVVLTGNTCISLGSPRVSRRRCTRSVYTRGFLDSPFETESLFRREISRGFFQILEIDVAGNSSAAVSSFHEMLCCFYGGTWLILDRWKYSFV